MAQPNLPIQIRLHAAGIVLGAAGAIFQPVNCAFVKNGIGNYSIFLGTPISLGDRILKTSPPGPFILTVINETDASFDVLTNNLLINNDPVDINFSFELTRFELSGSL